MAIAELRQLGMKLRTQVRGPVFEYIEGTLPLLKGAAASDDTPCPECAKRRKAKAAAQRRWRKRAKK